MALVPFSFIRQVGFHWSLSAVNDQSMSPSIFVRHSSVTFPFGHQSIMMPNISGSVCVQHHLPLLLSPPPILPNRTHGTAVRSRRASIHSKCVRSVQQNRSGPCPQCFSVPVTRLRDMLGITTPTTDTSTDILSVIPSLSVAPVVTL